MPTALRRSLLFWLIALGGFSQMVSARFVSGWDALALFASGLITAGGGLLGALILSVIAMIPTSRWRRVAFIEALVAGLFMILLAILWKLA